MDVNLTEPDVGEVLEEDVASSPDLGVDDDVTPRLVSEADQDREISPTLLMSYDTLDDWKPDDSKIKSNQITEQSLNDISTNMSSTIESDEDCTDTTIFQTSNKNAYPDILASLPESGKESTENNHLLSKEEIDGKFKEHVASLKSNSLGEKDDQSENFDFSVVAISDSSHLNFDLSKHKRSLSKKGSIAHRKRPSRAAIKAVKETSDENKFNDSTEPKLSKSSISENITETTPEPESEQEKSQSSIGKKIAGGFKIPGLLEGLNKSKSFKRAERSNKPLSEPSKSEHQISNLTKTKGGSSSDVSQTSLSSTSPPKPQPRILPKPPSSKVLKDAENQSTANETKNINEENNLVENKKETVKTNSALLQELKKKQIDSQSSSTPSSAKSDLSSIPSKPLPPTLKPKPSNRSPPSIASKPIAPIKPKKTTNMEAGDSISEDSSAFTKKRVLPSIGNNKKSIEFSSGDGTTYKKDLRSTSSFRANPDLGRKELKPTTSFRSPTIQNAVISPTEYLSRLKKTPEVEKSPTGRDTLTEAPTDQIKNNVDNKTTTENSLKKVDSNEIIEEKNTKPQRKSSVSHVESPLEKEKSSDQSLTRQRSISGSVYAPIGFRSPLSSTDSETKSADRHLSSSETSGIDSFPSNNEMLSDSHTLPQETTSETSVSESNCDSSNNVFNSDQKTTTNETCAEQKETILSSKDERSIRMEYSNKEATSSSFNSKQLSDTPINRGQGDTDENRFGVQLRKKEKQPDTATQEPTSEDKDNTPFSWRRSLSSKRRSSVTEKKDLAKDMAEVDGPAKWRQNLKEPEKNISDISNKTDSNAFKSNNEQNETPLKWRQHLSSIKRDIHEKEIKVESDSNLKQDEENEAPYKWRQQLSTKKRNIPTKAKESEPSEEKDKESPLYWRNQLSTKKRNIPEKNNDTSSCSNDEIKEDSPNKWRQQLSTKRRSFTPNNEIKTESTPGWAQDLDSRRQRLIEQGIIKTDHQ